MPGSLAGNLFHVHFHRNFGSWVLDPTYLRVETEKTRGVDVEIELD